MCVQDFGQCQYLEHMIVVRSLHIWNDLFPFSNYKTGMVFQ